MAYRCSLCEKVVPNTACSAHTDWHRLQPGWLGSIGFVFVEDSDG